MCTFLNLAAGLGLVAVTMQPVFADSNERDLGLLSEGTALFVEHCAQCHGLDGRGDGPLAKDFTPRPRDLSQGTFKLKSTGLGEYPSRADVLATLRRGITGSYGVSMPAYDFLDDRALYALSEAVRVLAEIDQFDQGITAPARPEVVDLARGAALYEELTCARCHGTRGDGAGELAAGLESADGLPIRPANFTIGQFKGGNAPEDIWMRIYAGLPGTPMPAYGRNSTAVDIWALTEYVLTFSN